MNTSWEWAKEFPPASEEAIRGFAASIGDNNPIHHDNIAAINGGLRKIVAPGLMVMGFLSAAIAEENPGVMISEINRLIDCSSNVRCTRVCHPPYFVPENTSMDASCNYVLKSAITVKV